MSLLPEATHDAVCAACKGVKCCVNYRVSVTGCDVQRLVKGLSLSPQEVSYLQRVKTEAVQPFAVFLSRARDPYELCLQKKPPRTQDPTEKRPCAFLIELDSFTRRCGVYPHRPMVCRMFPTVATSYGVDVVQRTTCPPRAWTIERVDIPTAQVLHDLWRIERDLYCAFLERWNLLASATPEDRRLSTEAFFFMLLKFYGGLDPAKQATFEAPAAQAPLASGWRAAVSLHAQPWTLLDSPQRDALLRCAGPIATAFMEAARDRLADLDRTVAALIATTRAQVNHNLQSKLDRLSALMAPPPTTPQP
jgi:Fe-S-cluster containining protein